MIHSCQYRGRIVKLMGDGALVEFASVVDAVACALAVQAGVASRQAEVPSERRIVFRIGINLGDVVVDGDDLMGDGVNIAARLEQLSEPGGVMISGMAMTSFRASSMSRWCSQGNRRSRISTGQSAPIGLRPLHRQHEGASGQRDAACGQPQPLFSCWRGWAVVDGRFGRALQLLVNPQLRFSHSTISVATRRLVGLPMA